MAVFKLLPVYTILTRPSHGVRMGGNIIDLVARLGRPVSQKQYKSARDVQRPRILFAGMKFQIGFRDTVELRIVSDEPNKPRRNLSRVTLYVDELRQLIREIEGEPLYQPQLSPTDEPAG